MKELTKEDFSPSPVLEAIIENGLKNGYPIGFDKVAVSEDKGLRHNKGKIRYDLLEPFAITELAKVFTKGAEKYADRNWEKGMKWSKMRASLGRHLAAYDNSEDYDFDPMCEACKAGNCVNHTGLYHIAQVAWNALGILSYYKLFPQGDDRPHRNFNRPKIGLDIDNVICDWTKGWGDYFQCKMRPDAWNYTYDNSARFKSTPKETLHDMYSKMPRQVEPSDIPFEPHCYITARSIDPEVTKKWIEDNGFPCAPVYTVPFMHSKVEVAKEAGVDWVIDDSFANFVELNNAGICCFLYDAPHNRRYDVGYKRVKDFKDFKDRFL